MNSNNESAAKHSFWRMSPKDDRQIAVRMLQYLLFYGCLLVCTSVVSFLLDVLFYRLDYGSSASVYYTPLDYILFFAIVGYWLFPLSLIYNYAVNELRPSSVSRVIGCTLLLLFAFLLIRTNYEFGHYIGQYRQLKNMLTAVLSGLAVECIRNKIVSVRIRKYLEKAQKQESQCY